MDSFPKSLNPNKRLKEEFVSNLTGTSMLEIAAITTIIPLLFLVRRSLGFMHPSDVVTLKKDDDAKVGAKSWQAYMAALSVDFLFIMVPFVLFLTVLADWMYIWTTLLTLSVVFSFAAKRFGFGSTLKEEPDSVRKTITSHRVVMMILTCLCILAVDFKIFPRRYAKTETYGTGLGLNMYLLSNERGSDIISQNKEGLFSIFGYWSMYLIGVQVGNFLFFSNHSSATTSRKKSTRNRAAILSLLFWLVTLVVDSHVERVSRRSCNLPYVTLVLATNLQGLAIVLVSDSLPGTKTSTIEEAYNRNLLAIFLLANFLTGLINFLVDTLFASTVKALSVMIAYAFMLTFIPGRSA